MKKWICLFVCLFLLGGCSTKTEKEEEKKEPSNSAEEMNHPTDDSKDTCQGEYSLYVAEEKRNLYLVCLDDFMMEDKEEEKTLFHYMKEHDYSIQDISMGFLSFLPIVEDMSDLGITIYRGSLENYGVEGEITFIACNTQEGNKDVYIGPGDLDYQTYIQKGFCQNGEI